MGIRVTCTCKKVLLAKDELEGKKVQCPACHSIIAVPLTSAYPIAPRSDTPVPFSRLTEDSKQKKKKPPAPTHNERTETELLRTILAAFDREAPTAPRAHGYHLGLVLVAFAMVLLPVIYLLLIGCFGYLLYWHATHNFAFFTSRINFWFLIFGYVGPLVAGVILLFFMIKPLFASSPRAGGAKVLEPEKEVVLFEFINCIAQSINAPKPHQIEVSCEVNASASLGRGLSGLLGNQLTLTLGLPLIVGLNARQLAGVIAHEMGHFSQGAGMRLSDFIRSINNWFGRVVYERDGWDEALARQSEDPGYMAPIFWLAMLGIWLTRRVLWALMIIGHFLSCFLLRHMEYDADLYMARLCGSETLEEIFRRLALWEVSCQVTFSFAGDWWLKDRYPDDLPTLIVENADHIPKKLHRAIQKSLNKSQTSFFDTHPCLKDRIANVHRDPTDGIVQFDEPATVLLRDFPNLSRQVSLKLHQAMFGRRVKRDMLVSIWPMEDAASEG